jgi:polyphosphate kinase 2 (PPK2 family)
MPNTNVAASAAWAVASLRRDPAAIRHLFESGEYPDKTLMRAKSRNAHVLELQRELLKAQRWIEKSGQRIVVLFEGRDAAGKGGTIKRFTRHINPRTARVVALQKPIERERTQRYFQRYIAPLPAAGEIVLFDRSWHNRTGVERVMSFRPPNDYLEFMRRCPDVEHMLVRSEITLIKFWFSVSCEEQRRRLIVGSSAYVIGTGPGIINKAVHPSAKRDREISAA